LSACYRTASMGGNAGCVRNFPRYRRLTLSIFGRWSQPIDATLYLEGEMECDLMGHYFIEGLLRQPGCLAAHPQR
jgi:hypothetical protein